MCAFSLMFGNNSRCLVCVCVFFGFLPSAVARIMSVWPDKIPTISETEGAAASLPPPPTPQRVRLCRAIVSCSTVKDHPS